MYTRRCQWHTLSGRYTRAAPLHVAVPAARHGGGAVRHVAGMIGRHGAYRKQRPRRARLASDKPRRKHHHRVPESVVS